jgi:hypothetical protein
LTRSGKSGGFGGGFGGSSSSRGGRRAEPEEDLVVEILQIQIRDPSGNPPVAKKADKE